MAKNKKDKKIGISHINYRIKTFLDKGVTKDEIFEIIKDTEDFNPAYWRDGKIISDAQAKKAGLEIIDPKVLQGLADALPTWQQLKKNSEYDDIEDILADFFAKETVGDVLSEFRAQYYDLMNKIANTYGFRGHPSTRIARAESLLMSNKGTKSIINEAKSWGEKYYDKKNTPMRYQDAMEGLKHISKLMDQIDYNNDNRIDFGSTANKIAEMLKKNKGVHAE